MEKVILDDVSVLKPSLDAERRFDGPGASLEVVSLSDLIAESGGAAEFSADTSSDTIICTADIGTAAQLPGYAARLQHPALLDAATGTSDFVQYYVTVPASQIGELKRETESGDGFVPIYRDFRQVVAITSGTVSDALTSAGLAIERLGPKGLPETHDLYLMRDHDCCEDSFADGFGAFFGDEAQVIHHSDEGLFVAIPAGSSIEDFHFPVTNHGHNLKLIPDPALLKPASKPAGFAVPRPAEPVEEDVRYFNERVEAWRIGELVATLSGAASGEPTISSRHVHHPDCDRAVSHIRNELRACGLDPRDHSFMHEGRRLQNVYTDIEGRSPDLVLVTAHLDSRAGRGEPGYRPDRDPAPGADDDASGVAAVLELARVMRARNVRPDKTIRFALFHAEEHGLVGSRHFARAAAEAGQCIEVVFQMDMIGFVPDPGDKRFEVHCGFRASPEIEARSKPFAELVGLCAEALGELGPAEFYASPTDPADGRSDHSSFHMSGFPAVIVSENFFGGPVTSPMPEPNNPQYHSSTDVAIEISYAAEIAKMVGMAAWTAAAG